MFAKRNLRAKYIIQGAAGLVPRIGTGGLADHIAELGYTQTYAFVTEVGSREYNAQTMGPARCFNVSSPSIGIAFEMHSDPGIPIHWLCVRVLYIAR